MTKKTRGIRTSPSTYSKQKMPAKDVSEPILNKSKWTKELKLASSQKHLNAKNPSISLLTAIPHYSCLNRTSSIISQDMLTRKHNPVKFN